MAKAAQTYNNLIDICLSLETETDDIQNAGDSFKVILTDYFFKDEIYNSKKMEYYFDDFESPPFMKDSLSIFQINIDTLRTYINGNMVNDSLCGQIMFSQAYLKSFHSNHPPAFSKLPEDVKFDLVDDVKDKNSHIISAFEKMHLDREADKNRKIITLIALVLKNIHLKTGRPFNRLEETAEEIISNLFQEVDEIFKAEQKQVKDLEDDTKIKELIKTFFIIKQFKEITDMAELYKKELDRFIKRTKHILS